jgi:hypothetical protein
MNSSLISCLVTMLLAPRLAAAAGLPISVCVGEGDSGSAILNELDLNPAPTNVCANPIAGRWLSLEACGEGLFVLDTIGSEIDTVLAVYTWTNLLAPLIAVACDDDGAPDGLRSKLVFPALAGDKFFIFVGGKDSVIGRVQLNWVLATFRLRIASVRSDGEVQVHLYGPRGHAHVVERTLDLVHWSPVHTNASSALPLDIVAAVPPDSGACFYRARPWPNGIPMRETSPGTVHRQ